MVSKIASRKVLGNDALALVIFGMLIFGIPIAWVCNAFVQGQRPFETPPSASTAVPTR